MHLKNTQSLMDHHNKPHALMGSRRLQCKFNIANEGVVELMLVSSSKPNSQVNALLSGDNIATTSCSYVDAARDSLTNAVTAMLRKCTEKNSKFEDTRCIYT